MLHQYNNRLGCKQLDYAFNLLKEGLKKASTATAEINIPFGFTSRLRRETLPQRWFTISNSARSSEYNFFDF
jgi:hypothetical protein